MDTKIERCRRYVAAKEPAVSHQGGWARTQEVAGAIFCEFALDENDGYPILKEYNQRCQPPWNEDSLRHFMEQAMGRTHRKPTKENHEDTH